MAKSYHVGIVELSDTEDPNVLIQLKHMKRWNITPDQKFYLKASVVNIGAALALAIQSQSTGMI